MGCGRRSPEGANKTTRPPPARLLREECRQRYCALNCRIAKTGVALWLPSPSRSDGHPVFSSPIFCAVFRFLRGARALFALCSLRPHRAGCCLGEHRMWRAHMRATLRSYRERGRAARTHPSSGRASSSEGSAGGVMGNQCRRARLETARVRRSNTKRARGKIDIGRFGLQRRKKRPAGGLSKRNTL